MLAASLLVALACGEAPVAPRANVIVITIDTTRADALGAYGQAKPTSPRIDALAAAGTLFEDAVTSSPSTFPSHASIFTGKQPFAHGVRSNAGFLLAAEHETLAEVMSAAGWVTHAEIAAPVLAAPKRLDQGFDTYRDPASLRDPLVALDGAERYRRIARDAEDITARGLEFVREHAGDPFLLWLHYFDPHKPYAPPEDLTEELAPYHAEIRRVDREVGRLLDELDALGIAERTLVVVTSDHGEGQGQHGEATHSFLVYESTMRVPLVFAGPGVPAGVRVRALARTVDVTPTLLDLLGLPPLPEIQGVSLRPSFFDPQQKPSRAGYGESIEGTLAFGSSVLRFVRVGRWKYIHKERPELYDVVADPTEVRNQFDARERTVSRLRRRLEEIVAETPAAGGDSRVELDPEQVEALRALGYAALDAEGTLDDELDSLEIQGPDPNDRLADVEAFADGWGFVHGGQWDRALESAAMLLERDPDGHLSHGLRVAVLQRSGRDEELVPALRAALAATPDAVDHAVSLAAQLMRRGEVDEPVQLLEGALERDACAHRGRLLLSRLYQLQGRHRAQLALLEEVAPSCRRIGTVHNAVAYLLATSPDDAVRDGARALRMAQELAEGPRGQSPDFRDTLAAAYAETGDFAAAVREQERVLEQLEGRPIPPDVRASFERNLATLREGRPIRATPEP